MLRSAFLASLFLCAGANAQVQTAVAGGPGLVNSAAVMGAPMDQVDFLAAYLGLSTAQADQAKPLFNAERDAIANLFTSMKQAQDALGAAEKSNQPDSEIDRLAGVLGAVQGQVAAAHSKTFTRFRMLLTPDQKDKLDKLQGPSTTVMMGPGIMTTSGGASPPH
jgi:Spy/CpxP family protein refolding chaperone